MVIDIGSILEGCFKGYLMNSVGLLQYRGSVYIPQLGDLRRLVMFEAHKAPYSVHPVVKKMHADLKKHYYWPRMKRDIVDFVARCLECQRVKAEHQHLGGLLQPHSIPEWKWDTILIDFITG